MLRKWLRRLLLETFLKWFRLHWLELAELLLSGFLLVNLFLSPDQFVGNLCVFITYIYP